MYVQITKIQSFSLHFQNFLLKYDKRKIGDTGIIIRPFLWCKWVKLFYSSVVLLDSAVPKSTERAKHTLRMCAFGKSPTISRGPFEYVNPGGPESISPSSPNPAETDGSSLDRTYARNLQILRLAPRPPACDKTRKLEENSRRWWIRVESWATVAEAQHARHTENINMHGMTRPVIQEADSHASDEACMQPPHTRATSREPRGSNSIAHAFTRFPVPLPFPSLAFRASIQFPYHRPLQPSTAPPRKPPPLTRCNPHSTSLTPPSLAAFSYPVRRALPFYASLRRATLALSLSLSRVSLSRRSHLRWTTPSPCLWTREFVDRKGAREGTKGKEERREGRQTKGEDEGKRSEKSVARSVVEGRRAQDMQRWTRARARVCVCVLENLPLPFRISFLRAQAAACARTVRADLPGRKGGRGLSCRVLTALDSRPLRCTYRVVTPCAAGNTHTHTHTHTQAEKT